MLRADMLRVYYKHLDAQQIHQHEYENFMYEYKMPQGTAFPNVSQKIRLPEAFLFYPFSIVPIPSSVVHPSCFTVEYEVPSDNGS